MGDPLKKISTEIFELSEKKRSLEVETNKAQSTYDTVSKQATEAAEGLTAIGGKIEELVQLSGSINSLGLQHVEQVGSFVNDGIEVLRKIGTLCENAFKAIDSIDKSVDGRLEQLRQAEQADAIRWENIVEETKRLKRIEKDLDIYRKRLQTKYNELGLGPLII